MKRPELYNKIIELSDKYGLPVKINKQTKKAILEKVYNNLLQLKNEDKMVDDNMYEDINTIISDCTEDINFIEQEEIQEPIINNDEPELEPELEPETPIKKKTLKSGKMKKLLKKKSIQELKKEVNKIIIPYNKETNNLIKLLKEEQIDENMLIEDYNNIREHTENEINLSIDDFDNNIPESFYTWCESLLDTQKNKLEKYI